MKIITVLGGIAVAVLLFFAIIFALAASVQETTTRLVASGLLFIIALVVIVGIYFTTRKPKTVIQQLEVSGQMKAASIKCPNCGAAVHANLIKIVSGVPYATCPYCGTTFEVTEEPKW
jgi:DNA-directed RNA polymerase subunit RPC12/RpoP